MKIVKEHINEKFQEESDPIRDMDIGGINLGRIRTKLRKDYCKKILKTYKDLIYKKTITGTFNETAIVVNNSVDAGKGWGKYTIFVDTIFNESEIDEDTISLLVFDNKKHASYMIPITDQKIFIEQ